MPKNKYWDFEEINENQTKVMRFIIDWVKTKKTPVPHHEIIVGMKAQGYGEPTVVGILGFLLKNGYIRRAVVPSNKSFYIQIRTI